MVFSVVLSLSQSYVDEELVFVVTSLMILAVERNNFQVGRLPVSPLAKSSVVMHPIKLLLEVLKERRCILKELACFVLLEVKLERGLDVVLV